MKAIFTIEYDPFEEREDASTWLYASERTRALYRVTSLIRSRLKHAEDVTDAEQRHLEELLDILYETHLE